MSDASEYMINNFWKGTLEQSVQLFIYFLFTYLLKRFMDKKRNIGKIKINFKLF